MKILVYMGRIRLVRCFLKPGKVVLSHQIRVRIPVALPALRSRFPLIFVSLICHRFGGMGRGLLARRAHNPEVVGSNPTPATTPFLKKFPGKDKIFASFFFGSLSWN